MHEEFLTRDDAQQCRKVVQVIAAELGMVISTKVNESNDTGLFVLYYYPESAKPRLRNRREKKVIEEIAPKEVALDLKALDEAVGKTLNSQYINPLAAYYGR